MDGWENYIDRTINVQMDGRMDGNNIYSHKWMDLWMDGKTI